NGPHRMRFYLLAIALVACGRERVSVVTPAEADAGEVAQADAGADADAGEVAVLPALEGRWDVEGADPRGTYTGAIRIADGSFQREIAWKTATVEGGRALHWAFSGAADGPALAADRKSTRLNSSHDQISYAVF